MKILVKICGIRSAHAAKAAQKAGADMLGFNFVPTSNRRVSIEIAREIIDSLPKKGRPKLVGVFQNAPLEKVQLIMKGLGLDMAQLHGRESDAYARALGFPVIKAIGLTPDFDPVRVARPLQAYPAKYFLLDRASQGKGKTLDIAHVTKLARHLPVILAGGLAPETIRMAIRGSGRIKGVDVAGGVETKGKQDLVKIRRFIREARLA
ncbi:MAG: phosphoribosylanthranilate isomerase [Patescibacteria group bacterium]